MSFCAPTDPPPPYSLSARPAENADSLTARLHAKREEYIKKGLASIARQAAPRQPADYSQLPPPHRNVSPPRGPRYNHLTRSGRPVDRYVPGRVDRYGNRAAICRADRYRPNYKNETGLELAGEGQLYEVYNERMRRETQARQQTVAKEREVRYFEDLTGMVQDMGLHQKPVNTAARTRGRGGQRGGRGQRGASHGNPIPRKVEEDNDMMEISKTEFLAATVQAKLEKSMTPAATCLPPAPVFQGSYLPTAGQSGAPIFRTPVLPVSFGTPARDFQGDKEWHNRTPMNEGVNINPRASSTPVLFNNWVYEESPARFFKQNVASDNTRLEGSEDGEVMEIEDPMLF
ncbi:hypothetical protein EDC01DRAFT_636156 [Geopyxis carbonaria]|nr:hypothetical protein EDC01DRAFT_636156 [Geopyxis carbonaria]